MNFIINAEIEGVLPPSKNLLSYGHFYHHLLSCLGYKNETLPLGDLLRRYHGLEGQWAVVTPILWQATHNDAVIVACGGASKDEENQPDWFKIWSDHAALYGMKTYYHDENTWLIGYDNHPSITAASPYSLRQCSLMPALTALDDSHFWQRFLTETQMLFYYWGAEEYEGPNGIWVWGAGSLDVPQQNPIICLDEYSLKLAQYLSSNALLDDGMQSFNANTLLIWHEFEITKLIALQQRLTNLPVDWYWNDKAYRTKAATWWSRLIRKNR